VVCLAIIKLIKRGDGGIGEGQIRGGGIRKEETGREGLTGFVFALKN
jgi:hypothetical protein